MRATCAAPDLPYRIRFLADETSTVNWRARSPAYQRMWVQVALAWIVDDAADPAVKPVARLNGCRSHCRKLGLRDRRSDIQVHDKLRPKLSRNEAVPIEGRCAGEDPVVILGNICASIHPCRPPVEQPFQFE